MNGPDLQNQNIKYTRTIFANIFSPTRQIYIKFRIDYDYKLQMEQNCKFSSRRYQECNGVLQCSNYSRYKLVRKFF